MSRETILATDCGSTTTKAILIEKENDGYRLKARGEAPTTVEKPFENVTIGVRNSFSEVEELTGRKLLEDGSIARKRDAKGDVDSYVSTSSAGGGLQMLVAGVVKAMTGESAARAALGAGAIVMETIASNDGRLPHERVDLIRKLRPDMILLAGGIDGGTVKHVVEIAELIKSAEPRPRFGVTFEMPVIYAGNVQARDEVAKLLTKDISLHTVENIRPVLELENLGPAREIIHELFMEHVMQQAPGYNILMDMTDVPIMPTPGAVGLLMEEVARRRNVELLGVDIGGATTDIFSVFKGIFNRTVSANLGMSYSVSNVMVEAGIENITRWVPFHIDESDIRNRVRNKMIRPTTIPMYLEGLIIEQAIAREALRLALMQHREMAVSLKGVQQTRTIGEAFTQTTAGQSLVDMLSLNTVIGSGGVLSHAPRRSQAALMLLDGFQPEGVTRLAVDSIFMMPHLGVLSTVNPDAATEVFERDCLIRLGTCIAPRGAIRQGKRALTVTLEAGDGHTQTVDVPFGSITLLTLGASQKAKATIEPARGLDVGEGRGKRAVMEIEGGVVGVIIDARGRPLHMPRNEAARIEKTVEWIEALNVYPAEQLRAITAGNR